MMGNNKGFSLVEVAIVLVLMGLATMAIIAIMNSINSNVIDAQNRMNLSTFGMESKQHLRKNHSDGISYCMVHPTGSGTSFSPKAIGQIFNDAGSAKLSQIVMLARTQPGSVNNFVDLGKVIPFSNDEIYGGKGTDKSADFMTLLSSRMHSFVIRKTIQAYVIPSPRVVRVVGAGADIKRNFLYVVSAVYENKFIRGLAPANLNSIEPSKIISSRIQVNFVIRNINNNHRVIDCGTTNLVKTTAFVESCRALGADFEYVLDRPATVSGQCYAPEYYTSAVANGQNLGTIQTYVPLRSFLCEAAVAGKSLNMPFCTGIY